MDRRYEDNDRSVLLWRVICCVIILFVILRYEDRRTRVHIERRRYYGTTRYYEVQVSPFSRRDIRGTSVLALQFEIVLPCVSSQSLKASFY